LPHSKELKGYVGSKEIITFKTLARCHLTPENFAKEMKKVLLAQTPNPRFQTLTFMAGFCILLRMRNVLKSGFLGEHSALRTVLLSAPKIFFKFKLRTNEEKYGLNSQKMAMDMANRMQVAEKHLHLAQKLWAVKKSLLSDHEAIKGHHTHGSV
jgi:hypothetical protein